jgi:3-phenylpropionate/trans-cinnamate dioxygenase ferredoxin subunit
MTRFVAVAPLAETPENGNKAFEVEGRSVLICRSGDNVFAVENLCSHAASALEGGRIRGFALFCPVHGARFDLRTGCTAGALTQTPIQTFAVRVKDGMVEVDLA